MRAAALALTDLDEKAWSHQLVGTAGNPGLARTLGWNTCYHTLRSKGSASGFPDWVLVRERVIYLELKTETGKVSAAQAEWIRALLHARAEVYVVRPRHLDEIAKVLSGRKKWGDGEMMPHDLYAEVRPILDTSWLTA